MLTRNHTNTIRKYVVAGTAPVLPVCLMKMLRTVCWRMEEWRRAVLNMHRLSTMSQSEDHLHAPVKIAMSMPG